MPRLTPRLRRALAGLLLSAPALGAQPAPADSARVDSARSEGARSGGARHAPALSERIAVHGYLTQGWAQSTGVPFYGMTSSASTDFRYAAVQVRFAATPRDAFLVQLNHRRLGRSPITDFESDVNLNWAFYQRTLGEATTLKAGRIAIPRGIYNELRSVGVSLPMYRAPVVFYDEGAYYSETIDGLVASHTFRADAPWSVEAHLYGGGWRSLAYDNWSPDYAVVRVRAENAVGGQLWLHTPLEGVRVGAAAQRYDYDQGEWGRADAHEWHLSFDATRERGFARAEMQMQDWVVDRLYSGYVQLGARPHPRLLLVAELQRSRDTEVTYGEGLPSEFEWHRSDGVGATWQLAPNFLLKAEHHWDRGIQVERPADPRNPSRFRYFMASLSASF